MGSKEDKIKTLIRGCIIKVFLVPLTLECFE
jgi:hypothetical protein